MKQRDVSDIHSILSYSDGWGQLVFAYRRNPVIESDYHFADLTRIGSTAQPPTSSAPTNCWPTIGWGRKMPRWKSKTAIRIAFDSHGHRLSTIPLATPAAAVIGAVWLLLGVSQCHGWYIIKNPRSSKCKVKRPAYLAVNRILIFRDNQSNFKQSRTKMERNFLHQNRSSKRSQILGVLPLIVVCLPNHFSLFSCLCPSVNPPNRTTSMPKVPSWASTGITGTPRSCSLSLM